jgi:DNA repair exonuclease SbcCD ATPase subunit
MIYANSCRSGNGRESLCVCGVDHERLQRNEEQATKYRMLQREMDALQASNTRSTDDRDELVRTKKQMEAMEREARDNAEITAELRKETRGLLEELKNLNMRHDELLAERESEQAQLRIADEQAATFKRKYEEAKTELRRTKGRLAFFIRLVLFSVDNPCAYSDIAIVCPVAETDCRFHARFTERGHCRHLRDHVPSLDRLTPCCWPIQRAFERPSGDERYRARSHQDRRGRASL